jgi:hypothetical protein
MSDWLPMIDEALSNSGDPRLPRIVENGRAKYIAAAAPTAFQPKNVSGLARGAVMFTIPVFLSQLRKTPKEDGNSGLRSWVCRITPAIPFSFAELARQTSVVWKLPLIICATRSPYINLIS